MAADTFAVLGDLGNGKYIVRMLVSGHIVDEEIEAANVPELRDKIAARQTDLQDKAHEVGLKAEESQLNAEGGLKSDGHAIPMTPEQGAE